MPEGKKSIAQLVAEAQAAGRSTIDVPPEREAELQEYLSSVQNNPTTVGQGVIEPTLSSNEPVSVEVPADPTADLVSEARRTGEFRTPGASGTNSGWVGQGGGRVGPVTGFSLGALDYLSGGLAPYAQGALVAPASTTTDYPVSREAATNAALIERNAAEQGLSSFGRGEQAAALALPFVPGAGIPLSLVLPVVRAAVRAEEQGRDPGRDALLSTLVGAGTFGVGVGASKLLSPLWGAGKRLAGEIMPEVRSTLQRLVRSEGGQVTLPGIGPAQSASTSLAQAERESIELLERLAGSERQTTMVVPPRTSLTPEAEQVTPDVLIRSRSEGRSPVDLMVQENARRKTVGIPQEEFQTIPPPGRAPRHRPSEPPTEMLDTEVDPKYVVMEADSIPPQAAVPSPRQAPASPPAAAPSLGSSRAVQGVERALRSAAGLGAWGHGLPGQVLAAVMGGSQMSREVTPYLTTLASMGLGGTGKVLGALSSPVASLLGEASSSRQAPPDPVRFAQMILPTELQAEARTILDADPSNRARAHSVLMERSPRYRQTYMRWAAEQNR